MSKKEIEPQYKNRVMDLIKLAGVDISDWQNYEGGILRAASNPKYCYDWAFVEPKKVVVLNLWYSKIIEKDGEIYQEINMRDDAKYFKKIPDKSVWSRRALKMDEAIQTALKDKLELRVIICDGNVLRERSVEAKASQVKKRTLDPLPWTITNYNWKNGDCKLIRGIQTNKFVDQFIIEKEIENLPNKRDVRSKVFIRNDKVRKNVLIRSKGKCEFCDKLGFEMEDGRIYLETHHIVALSEKGIDTESNVVALCPDHHREAHYGINQKEIKINLIQKIKSFYQYNA